MATSKFLPFQDVNGDGLPDVCDEVYVEEVKECPSRCVPNPRASVPDWRKRKTFQPFLNEKVCKYQITIIARDYTTTGIAEGDTEQQAQEKLNAIYEQYRGQAIEVLLQVYNKEPSEGAIELLKGEIEYSSFYLEPRRKSRLKLLYSVDHDVLQSIVDAPESDDDLEEGSPIEVTYYAPEMGPQLIRVRKALYLYSRFLNVYKGVEGGSVRYTDGNKNFDLSLYGDYGFTTADSQLNLLTEQLSDFLGTYGYNIPSILGFVSNVRSEFRGADSIYEITFSFSEDYVVEKIEFFTEACGTKPITMTAKLQHLNEMSAWKDKTAVAYFANLVDMDQDLQAREPLSWLDFIVKYTYPVVYATTSSEVESTVTSCLAEALASEGKQLGQDLLDEFFGLGDIIAYQFNEALCKATLEQKRDEDVLMGLTFKDLTRPSLTAGESGSLIEGLVTTETLGDDYQAEVLTNIYGMAAEQAYSVYSESNSAFATLCSGILGRGAFLEGDLLTRIGGCAGVIDGSPVDSTLEGLFEFGFDRIKLCGLFDLAFEVVNCLMGGVTLEEALAKIVESALQAMSIDNFEKLFVGLPADKQAELDALVKQKLESGDIFQDDSVNQATSDALAGGYDFSATDAVVLMSDNQAISALLEDYSRKSAEDKQTYEDAYTVVDAMNQGAESLGITFNEYVEQYTQLTDAQARSYQRDAERYISIQTRKTLEQRQQATATGYTGGSVESYGTSYGDLPTRTIAQTIDSLGSTLDADVVLEAYIQALIEVYSDNLLELVDELGKFPGAPLIANVLAAVDCPRPPLFTPSLLDYIKDFELPFCRFDLDITTLKLVNPFGYLPKIKDLFRLLFEIIKCQIQIALIKALTSIMAKLCDLVGNALCNALALTGDILSALPGGTNTQELKNIVREAICGPDADEQTIDDTVTDMIAQLGVGGAAFADQAKTMALAEDMSASLTRAEMNQLFLGDAPNEALDILDSLFEYEYPEFRDALPNKSAINSFFSNMGNLMPTSFKNTMRDFVDGLPDQDTLPANPTLCLSPEKYEEFCNLRVELLAGRALPEQAKEMCEELRGQLLDDLGEVAELTQNVENFPEWLDSQLPQLASDPGCDNGVIPYEPEEAAAIVTSALSGELEQLKTEFSEDMLGNGPGDKNWGMLNMMLCDTLGVPLTAHNRLANNRRNYVDYYSGIDYTVGLDLAGIRSFYSSLATADFSFAADISDAAVAKQRGAFPTHVGRYLQEYMNDIAGSVSLSLNNSFVEDQTTRTEITTRSQRDITSLPDFGYNIEIVPYLEDEKVEGYDITEKGRKRTADMTLNYQDNADGEYPDKPDWYSYGFDIEAYFSDLEESEGIVRNTFTDNVRIKIFEKNNLNVPIKGFDVDSVTGLTQEGGYDENEISYATTVPDPGDAEILSFLSHEFLAVDDTFTKVFHDGSNMTDFLSQYTGFQRAFTTQTDYMPQTLLIKDILEQKNVGLQIDPSQMSNNQSSIMKTMMSKIFSDISDISADLSESSWSFGSDIETLNAEDLDYGVTNDLGEFVLYNDTGYDNKDLILGISRDQYNNVKDGTPEKTRVFYLDPADYGGNYLSPPLYIRPTVTSGWLGLIDVMFPELNACDPAITDVVDFNEIQNFVSEIYPTLPEDERAKSNPDCVVELPYNRFLERSAKAGMMGLIKAAIRIYATTHFIKAFPTFTKFSPDFRRTFSSSFASYIVENMQKSFLDAQPGVAEFFNTFKDNEFWYGFLEQSVQMYGFMVDTGRIMDPPTSVMQAISRLNDLQEQYSYPSEEDLKEAKEVGETTAFKSLKNYRQELNLEAVRQTEEDAKLVMKELVTMELDFMAEKFMDNLKRLNIEVEVKDSDYYFLETFTQGGEGLTLNNVLRDDGSFTISTSLPTVPYEDNEEVTDPYYTYGGELVVDENAQNPDILFAYGVEAGQEYVGDYHVHISETTGQPVYMIGAVHSSDLHPVLVPLANITSVEFGDVSPIYSSINVSDSDRPFVLEKYIKINDVLHPPDNGVTIIKSQSDTSLLISDVYPGSMRLVLGPNNTPIGIDGELGVRYGLRLSMIYQNESVELTSVEIDALDTSLSDFTNLNGNSKLLLCLINNLKQDPNYILLSQYIFSTPKMLSLAAIYNDMGMLSSIGQISVEKGKTYARGASRLTFEEIGKPGQSIIRTVELDSDDLPVVSSLTTGPLEGSYNPITKEVVGYSGDGDPAPLGAWAHPDDRQRGLFFKEWDNWDKALLRNSTSRIKRLFKTYYNSRFFDESAYNEDIDSPGSVFLQRLREQLRPAAGRDLLPWWSRGRLRTNPFNANDEICEDDE